MMDNNRIGDFAEYYAITWLWDQGYEVFRNCGCTGAIDLVVVDPQGKSFYVDVKTMYNNTYTRNGERTKGKNRSATPGQLTPHQKKIGVQILGFDPETRKCRFVNHQHDTTYSRYRDEQHTQHDLALCNTGC